MDEKEREREKIQREKDTTPLSAYRRIGRGPTFTRVAMFENSRPAGMCLRGPLPLSLFPSFAILRLRRRSSDAFCFPLHTRVGAPNGRVTRDAPLACPGRARLLGAQMMYADHSLSLSLFFFLPPTRSIRLVPIAFLFLSVYVRYL